MDSTASHTAQLQNWLALLKQGDEDARQRLIEHACERLRLLTRKMLRGFPRVCRWEETDDIFVEAVTKLHRSLKTVQPETPQEFYRLGATQIRRVLIDMARRYYGPEGLGANYLSAGPGPGTDRPPRYEQEDRGAKPSTVLEWSDFHRKVESLPDDEREVFGLLWYVGLNQIEAADALGISERTLRRRWQQARLRLYEAMDGQPPGE
ncbi:MAG: sigma-70 family RNA polymerase sigma factor [Thermoguttaceae bacterium]|nr:sigma-70 family RNA polymerase sigma factor [Thermoguttaceae bacterium]